MAVAWLSEFESLLASDHHHPTWTLRPSLDSCPFPRPRPFAFRRFCSLTALDDLQAVSQASHSNRTGLNGVRDGLLSIVLEDVLLLSSAPNVPCMSDALPLLTFLTAKTGCRSALSSRLLCMLRSSVIQNLLSDTDILTTRGSAGSIRYDHRLTILPILWVVLQTVDPRDSLHEGGLAFLIQLLRGAETFGRDMWRQNGDL
ncbi:hypothetical protein B0H13DRAFT_1866328 [Mycena leptocephala]|nr:hypothetical protein B0H13DRAFT_1866328 [Mycena leptocephala]